MLFQITEGGELFLSTKKKKIESLREEGQLIVMTLIRV